MIYGTTVEEAGPEEIVGFDIDRRSIIHKEICWSREEDLNADIFSDVMANLDTTKPTFSTKFMIELNKKVGPLSIPELLFIAEMTEVK